LRSAIPARHRQSRWVRANVKEGEKVNAIKTGVVVVALLGVACGVWYVLNHRSTPAPVPEGVAEAMQWAQPPEAKLGPPSDSTDQAGSGAAPPTRISPPPTSIPGDERSPADNALRADNLATGAAGGSVTSIPRLTPDGGEESLRSPQAYPSGTGGGTAPTFPNPDSVPAPSIPEQVEPDRKVPDYPPSTPAGSDHAMARESSLFAEAWKSTQSQLDNNQLSQALRSLSIWYESPDLTDGEQARLQHLLDQLAGTVIYSTEHHLESAYVVQPGETLQDIARDYKVPWQLLRNINGVDDPRMLASGQELKVVRGPFNAIVNLRRREITLLLNGLYAGRFSFTPGSDIPPQPGTYYVQQKTVDPAYYDRNGREVPPNHPDNPYGKYRLDLGSS